MIPHSPFHLTGDVVDGVLAVRVSGDLDHHSSDELVGLVRVMLLDEPRPTAVRIDFGHLGALDSMGLSALLMVRRLARAAGAALHLDRRPPHLDRLLDLTGTLDHLTDPAHADDADPPSGRSRPASRDAPAPGQGRG